MIINFEEELQQTNNLLVSLNEAKIHAEEKEWKAVLFTEIRKYDHKGKRFVKAYGF